MSEETITIRRKEYEELSKNSEELQFLRKKNEELTLQIQYLLEEVNPAQKHRLRREKQSQYQRRSGLCLFGIRDLK